MTNSQTRLSRGYTIALISAVFLSTTAIFIRHLTVTYGAPALVLAFWRSTFVVLTLVVALGILNPVLLKVRRADLAYLALHGFILSIFNSLWTLSIAVNGAAVGNVLVYSSAAFTALLGWWLLKERLDWAKILTVLICLAGIVLVSNALDPSAWRTNLLGILTGILSGLGYAAYTLMGRAASQRGLNPWTTLLYAFGFGALFLLAYNLLPGQFLPGTAGPPAELLWLGTAWAGWGVLFVLAAGPTVAGFGLYNVSLVHLPSSVVNLIVTLEPAFTAAFAYLLLAERMTAVQIAGGLLIMAGVVFLRVYEARAARLALQAT